MQYITIVDYVAIALEKESMEEGGLGGRQEVAQRQSLLSTGGGFCCCPQVGKAITQVRFDLSEDAVRIGGGHWIL